MKNRRHGEFFFERHSYISTENGRDVATRQESIASYLEVIRGDWMRCLRNEKSLSEDWLIMRAARRRFSRFSKWKQ
jgi:hypothetical protein